MSEPVPPGPPSTPGAAGGPEADSESDFDEWTAWLDREIDAGRNPVPPEREPAPGLSISLGDASDVDPELLFALCGPDGLGGQSLGQQFGQGSAADALRPGPVLAALTEQAIDDLYRLNNDQLIGVLRASQRLASREAWKQMMVTAEFARRREAALTADTARGIPVHCRAGEFPGEELAAELRITGHEAASTIATAQHLTARLHCTLTALADGLIDARRATVISNYVRSLSEADATTADETLSAYAVDKRVEQLARKAAALEMRLAPEAVRARKERERRISQRVEVRREFSGNASLSAREMDTADAVASKAYIDAIATRLRNAGIEGALGTLRIRVLTELTQGRDPLGLIGAGSPPAGSAPPGSPPPAPGPDSAARPHSAAGPGPAAGQDPARAPIPALVNLLVPLGTYLGWSTAPAQAGSWGLLDAAETRDVTRAAALHPRTRWCATIIGPDGTAVAHACARGQHPWMADLPRERDPAASVAHPPPEAAAHLAAVFRHLELTFRPIAAGTCDHASAETDYLPGRSLRHLVRARTATCTAPGCLAQAADAGGIIAANRHRDGTWNNRSPASYAGPSRPAARTPQRPPITRPQDEAE